MFLEHLIFVTLQLALLDPPLSVTDTKQRKLFVFYAPKLWKKLWFLFNIRTKCDLRELWCSSLPLTAVIISRFRHNQ